MILKVIQIILLMAEIGGFLWCNGSRFYPSLLRVFLELSPPWTGAFLEHSRRVI